MNNKALKTVLKYNMISRSDTVGVGLSGGADSTALLHFLVTNRETLGIAELKAVHVHHGIRGAEADRDMEFSKRLCEKYGVEFLGFYADVPTTAEKSGESLEECARRIRYDFFEKAECDKFATAHNLNDNIETFLLNLARGSSLSGLCAIPCTRGIYIRPLIECTRQEIECYLSENGLDYVTDSTNLSDDYTRNKIRHIIVPALYEINPAFDRAFSKCLESVKLSEGYIAEKAQGFIEKNKKNECYDCTELTDCHDALKFQIIGRILKDKNAKNISREHIFAVDNIIRNGGKANVGGGLTVRCERGILTFGDICSAPPFEKSVEIENTAVVTPWGEYKIYILFKKDLQNFNKEVLDNLIDCDKISNNLILRNRREGDSIRLRGRGATKTLKKLFNEYRVPTAERSRRAMLSDSEGIVWLEGFGVSERCKADEKTEKYLLAVNADAAKADIF